MMRSRFILFAVLAFGIAVGIGTFLIGKRPDNGGPPLRERAGAYIGGGKPATYVGGQACATCHKAEHGLWAGSHHDRAMEEATQGTVLGDFNNTTFTHFGDTSTFYKKDEKFFARTEGPDGKLHDYEIKYTFGVHPLQQYLIEFPGGRYQVLGIGWDSRRRDEGGQRWFHLYPNENIPHDDELHWTGQNQNWNYMCAECHSTNLRKNYDLEQDRYKTEWSEIDVSCEACHGPGSRHIAWAESGTNGKKGEGERHKGLVVKLEAAQKATWIPNPETGTATRSKPRASHIQLNTCARCHSRRRVIHEEYVHGKSLLETHAPALLDEGLYHPDGQIQGEVYVYGSFLQSKMYRAGVTCSDCHDPHSLRLRAEGNNLCVQCHASATFDTPKHHFHKAHSQGAQCVECHMPAQNYMVIDSRRDHSIRIPRPDLSEKLGTPNACKQCHKERTSRWAAQAMTKWYGRQQQDGQHFGEVLRAGREGAPGADTALAKLAGDKSSPGIIRATALSLLGRYPRLSTLEALKLGVKDEDPLVRVGALQALSAVEPTRRYELANRLLNDPVRAVRIEAGHRLASVPNTTLSPAQQANLNKAVEEYSQAQVANAERASSHLNLGILNSERGQFQKAEDAYQTALRLTPSFYPALVNLADLYRVQQRDTEGEAVLRQALKIAPEDGSVHHALGLLLIRTGINPEAMTELKLATELQPDNPRYGYVYGIALTSIGEAKAAIGVLEKNHQRHPNDRQTLFALVTVHRDQGNNKSAIRYAEKLVALVPEDQAARQLMEHLTRNQ